MPKYRLNAFYNQEKRQCTFNVSLSGFRETISLPWKRSIYIITTCLYSFFIYPACKGHPSNCVVICGLSVPTILSHIILQMARF